MISNDIQQARLWHHRGLNQGYEISVPRAMYDSITNPFVPRAWGCHKIYLWDWGCHKIYLWDWGCHKTYLWYIYSVQLQYMTQYLGSDNQWSDLTDPFILWDLGGSKIYILDTENLRIQQTTNGEISNSSAYLKAVLFVHITPRGPI